MTTLLLLAAIAVAVGGGVWYVATRLAAIDRARAKAAERTARIKDAQLQVDTPRTPSDLATRLRESGTH